MSEIAIFDAALERDGSGIIGLAGALSKFASLSKALGKLSSPTGDEALAVDMVARMQTDVPVLTGALQLGVSYRFDAGSWVVEAKASRNKKRGPGADYAPFVEFGTAPHKSRNRRRAIADEAFFSQQPTGSGHPGTAAQPFFWQNARDVLAEHRRALINQADSLGDEFNS